MRVLIPDLTYIAGRFEADQAVSWDPASGRITAVGPAAELSSGATDVERLAGKAVLPGFVNAHSHAFQRLIRGRTQWRPAAEPAADFWSWRDSMYAAALALSPDDVFVASRFCFLEMIRAGITTVGEFHYLHRDAGGARYADPAELANRVIAAAAEVGIRIVLLNVCYAAGGLGEPLRPEQRRFATPDLDEYLADTEALRDAHRAEPLVAVGVAPHSVRAVPVEWLAELGRWAAHAGAAVHMHVSEQPAEVDACREAYGLQPVELLDREGVLDERFTAVHATHLSDGEIELLARAGATVCACPTTERDLGDGFLPGLELLGAGVPVALGTDSHSMIDPFAEMRLVEYHERLRRRRRVVLARPGAGDRLEAAPLLLELATAAGARSLGLPAGRLAPDSHADFIAVDLAHPALAGWTAETLAAMLVFSAPPDAVSDVWVGGGRRLEAGRHDAGSAALDAFRSVSARLGRNGAG